MEYPFKSTAFILHDPHNDFLSSLGKAWPLVRTVAKKVNLIENMSQFIQLGRQNNIPIAYVPHHRLTKESFKGRKYLHPSQILQKMTGSFSRNGFGGQYYKPFTPEAGDIIASEHQCSSGFTGTDLHSQLQAQGITHLVFSGFLSNTCIESSVRSALDLGYHITLLTDCIASWSPKDHAAAIEITYKWLGHEVHTLKQFQSIFSSTFNNEGIV